MKNTLEIYEKLFKYQHSQWLKNNENCFSKTKEEEDGTFREGH